MYCAGSRPQVGANTSGGAKVQVEVDEGASAQGCKVLGARIFFWGVLRLFFFWVVLRLFFFEIFRFFEFINFS